MRTVIERCVVAEKARVQFGHHASALLDPQEPVRRDRSDLYGVEPPFLEDRQDLAFSTAFGYQQHALLRFREHDFVGRHPALALRHAVEFDLDPDPAAAAHLRGRTGQPGRAHVLDAENRAGAHGLEASLEQELFQERIAHLDVGPLGLGILVELGRSHRCPLDAVPASLGPHVNDGVAEALGRPEEDRVLPEHPEGEDVHQRIRAEAGVEGAFPSDRGHPDAIAVVGDALDHPADDPPIGRAGLRVVGRAEPQGVEHRYGAGAHREDVAQDAADPGRRPLEGLDIAGMVVRLDLEGGRPAAADVDDARVLARSDQDPLASGGKLLQVQP